MAINARSIKRWYLMLTGKSVYHVDQGLGKKIQREQVAGYYNDLTQKVLKGDETLDEAGLPLLTHSNGNKVYMPTMIFQYGLGAFDLWLMSEKKDNACWRKAEQCADWAVDNQLENGAWSTFYYIYPDHPYSAMAQGEGASLLLRIYSVSKNVKYYIAAKKAIDFMLLEVSQGGVASYKEGLVLQEYTESSAILNGWIFALWGLYDFCIFDKSDKYKSALSLTISTLKSYLPRYDIGYWSLYNLDGMITSPFYHKLHISQLKAMNILFSDKIFEMYSKKFEQYLNNKFYLSRAFIVKAMQKLKEKE